MSVNVWGVVAGVPGFLPLSALTGTAGQILAMNAAATIATWQNVKILSDQLTLVAGSAAAPGLVFSGSLATGWYRPAADQWALSIANSQKQLTTAALHTFFQNVNFSSKLLQTDLGADIAAAATTDLGNATGNTLNITNAAGTVNIASLGGATVPAGTEIQTKFVITGGTVNLVHDAVALILLGGANITLVNGDMVRWRKVNDASAYWEMVAFNRGTSAGSVINTKGDLIVGTLSGGNIIPSRFGVDNAAGFLLFTDSTQPAGVQWQSPRIRNRILNGTFRFDQINEAAVYTVAGIAAVKTLDQFTLDQNCTGTITIQRELGGLYANEYNVKLSCTVADAVVSAGDYSVFYTAIEGYNISDLGFGTAAAKAVTLSFEVLPTNFTGILCISLVNNANNRYFIKEFVVTSGVQQKITVNIPGDVAGVWESTSNIGLSLYFTLMCGATLGSGAAGAWTAGAAFSTAAQGNFLVSNTNVLRIGRVQLEIGNIATPFELLEFTEELTRLQRYYQKSFPAGIPVAQNGGVTGAIQYYVRIAGVFTDTMYIPLKVPMRATPTMTSYNPGAANAKWRNGADVADSGTPAFDASDKGFLITNPQVAGDGVGEGLRIQWSADARLA